MHCILSQDTRQFTQLYWVLDLFASNKGRLNTTIFYLNMTCVFFNCIQIDAALLLQVTLL